MPLQGPDAALRREYEYSGARRPLFVSSVPARLARIQTALDRPHQVSANIDAKLLIQFADAGGARHVNLRDISADHLEPPEQHSSLRKLGPPLTRAPAVALIEAAADAARAGGEGAALLGGRGK